MKSFAKLISIIFDPVVLIPVILALVVYSMESLPATKDLVVLIFFYLLAPFLIFLWLVKTKLISDWWMTVRSDRHQVYSMVLISHLIALFYLWLVGAKELTEMLFIFWALTFVLAVATLFSKISLHVAVAASLVVVLIRWYSLTSLWWLWIIVGLVAWSRWRLGKHSLPQVISAFIIALLVLEFFI